MPDASTLRDDARACFQAGVAAVDPETLVRRFLEEHPDVVEVPGTIHLAAIGKAGLSMARGTHRVLGGRLAGGVLVVPQDQGLPEPGSGALPAPLEVFHGGHPVPNDEGVRGAEAILALTEGLGEGDLLLCLISGGGSALMTLPPEDVPLEDVQAVTRNLLRAGATIGELNAVRKHLDRLKGGRLARLAAPSRVLALVLSDVVGDPLDTIASGPVSPDPTTFADAVRVLERRGLWPGGVPEAARRHLERGLDGREDESPAPGDPAFAGVTARVVGNNRLAAEAALAEATARGYATALLTTLVTGEAREVGRVLAALALEIARSGHPVAPPACLVAAGETTVTVTGEGRGGRNQEVALGAAVALDELLGGVDSTGVLVASLGTDGIDGPTDAAGAVATGDTLERARRLDLDARRALADNDAYPFFQALDDLLVPGPTGTNVMDVMLALVAGARGS
ncbi:MAG: glycerate kinase [Thermoanaerobaculia bacterium]